MQHRQVQGRQQQANTGAHVLTQDHYSGDHQGEEENRPSGEGQPDRSGAQLLGMQDRAPGPGQLDPRQPHDPQRVGAYRAEGLFQEVLVPRCFVEAGDSGHVLDAAQVAGSGRLGPHAIVQGDAGPMRQPAPVPRDAAVPRRPGNQRNDHHGRDDHHADPSLPVEAAAHKQKQHPDRDQAGCRRTQVNSQGRQRSHRDPAPHLLPSRVALQRPPHPP